MKILQSFPHQHPPYNCSILADDLSPELQTFIALGAAGEQRQANADDLDKGQRSGFGFYGNASPSDCRPHTIDELPGVFAALQTVNQESGGTWE
jgi:hypothetical protein